MCFNNTATYIIECISWTIKYLILLMHGATMKTVIGITCIKVLRNPYSVQVLLLLLLLPLLLLYFRLCLFFQRLWRGSFDETFFPAFLRPASTAHSLWTTVSRDLCQAVVLHSPHMSIPLSSSILGPFNYVLNSA